MLPFNRVISFHLTAGGTEAVLANRGRGNGRQRCRTYHHILTPAAIGGSAGRHGTLVVATAQRTNAFLLCLIRHKAVKFLPRWRYNSGLKAGCNYDR